ncbi:MAG: hypothetical protein QY323_01510 [Patescibacteria group bacterium]|nr:MAG: hypothetical protein QY323_01510 [Patescibacteria group bacterium]
MYGKRSGNVLLLSLLIMSGVLVVGASLGTISILNLRQARVIDDSILAFGAAESGAEQTLYQIRRVGTPSSTLNANGSHSSSSALSGVPMGNGSSWTRTLTASETTVFTSIPKDHSYEVVLWNPESPSTPMGIESLTFSWDDDCGGTSGLEVFATGWDPSAVGGFNPNIGFHGDSTALTFLKATPNVIDNDFTSNRAYRVRLRAKTCDVSNLAITAYSADNAGGSQVPIPSRLSVQSTGTFGTARQAMELRLPRLQPLSGAFDFVIFSQCSLLKNVTGVPCF